MLLSWCAVSSSAAELRADVKLAESNGWTISTDGRVNGFYSHTHGENKPDDPAPLSPTPGSGVELNADNQNRAEVARVRSGFVGTVLNLTLARVVSPWLALQARLGLWWTIEQARSIAGSPNYPDGREAYLRLDGPWGGAMIGRTLALFSRGNIEIDALYGHGNGLGHPCDPSSHGPTCGSLGFGVMYPGFTPSIRYNTPTLAGFRVEAGIFDPTTLVGRYDRTPLPRVEAEAAYDLGSDDAHAGVHVFVNALWQRLVEANATPQPRTLRAADAWGVGYGARVHYGPAKLGLATHLGAGLGLSYPVEDTQYPADKELTLRKTHGVYGQFMLSVGATDVALGAGISRLSMTAYDERQVVSDNLIKSQRGLSAGVYQHLDQLVFALEYFRADYTWYKGNTQALNFINAGATLRW
jgi:hypothetical protein